MYTMHSFDTAPLLWDNQSEVNAMETIKRVFLYIRVSTESQFEDGYSIDEQKDRLLAYCKAHGWIVVAIFIDPGHSGSNLNRPAMQTMIEAAERRDADAVLVYKLDRLSRSQKDTLYLIEDVFMPNGVDFISMQENINTASVFGKAMIGVLSVFAQLEREQITERTMMGRDGRAKEGKWHGGGTEPIGYDYVNGVLEVNEDEAKQVRMIYQMYLHGHTVTEISERMSEHRTKHGGWDNLQTVATVLDNELYAGIVHFNGVRTPNAHTPIVPIETAARVHYMRERNRRDKYQQKESDHLLTGFVFCARCGARYFANRNPNGNVFYSCHSRAKKNRRMVKDRACKNDHWKKDSLDALIEDQIRELIANPQLINEIKRKSRAAKGSAEKTNKSLRIEALDEINKEINLLMDLYKDDRVPVGEIAQQIEVLHKRKMELAPGEVSERISDDRMYHIEHIKMFIREIQWDGSPLPTKRHLLRLLVDNIKIDGGNVDINWSFI